MMITLEIEPFEVDVGIEVEAVIEGGGQFPYYEGSYTAVPKTTQQVLPTKNKSMLDDVTVDSIPVSQIENPSGGWTFNIAYL